MFNIMITEEPLHSDTNVLCFKLLTAKHTSSLYDVIHTSLECTSALHAYLTQYENKNKGPFFLGQD